jgi:hypothetical protein
MNLKFRRHPFLCLMATVICSFIADAHAQTPASEFTTTDPKKVKILEDSALEKEPEIDHFMHLCPGLAGYEVFHEGGDLRSWINLRYKGTKTDLMNDTLTACPGQFPSKANHVVQWRGIRANGKFVPYAVIYRMRSSDEETQKSIETLIIIKLDGEKSRVVGHLPAKDGNEKAEALADRLCR